MNHRVILIALDSVGIDPLGHDRPKSIYAESEFLFPRGASGDVLPVSRHSAEGARRNGILVETDVTGGAESGAIECAITYASIFTGIDALERHGLMQGLGLSDRVLEEMVAESNLFRCFESPCLVNAYFPLHLEFLGGSYVQDLVPAVTKEEIERRATFRGQPVKLLGSEKHGFAELFTCAEINQNIFVHAARKAGVRLMSWDDVDAGRALTGSLTNELENDFDLSAFHVSPLLKRTPAEAAGILASLALEHDFVFYKYQVADLVSHTGRVDLARETFEVIEQFVGAVLDRVDTNRTKVIVTCDHGHLEQVAFHEGHPKSKVPTWYFGPDAECWVETLRRPQGVYEACVDGSRWNVRNLEPCSARVS
jgi:Metalloenzyme superfamily